MNKIKHYAATVVLLGVTSLGLAACGGETPTITPVIPTATTVPPTATTAPSPTPNVSSSTGSGAGMDLLNRADAAMKGVTSYHFILKTESGGGTLVQAEGDFMAPNSARLNLDMGAQGKVEMITIGQDSYIKNPLGEGYVSTGSTGDAGIAQSLSPRQFTSLAQGAQNVSVVGDETLDGASVTHVKFSYNLDKMAAQSTVTAGQPTPAATMGTATADMWVDKSAGYVRQFRFVSPSSAVPGMTTPTTTGDTTITVTYSKFNESVTPPIAKPTNIVTIPGASDVQTALPSASQLATSLPSASDLATAIPGASELMTALPIGGDNTASTPTP